MREVIEHAGMQVLVMDFVAGEALRTWVVRRRRSVSEIVDAYVGAAMGLERAHAIGLAHRGFASDHVLREPTGHVRVLAADSLPTKGVEGVGRDVIALCAALCGDLPDSLPEPARLGRVRAVLDRARTGWLGLAELRSDSRRCAVIGGRVRSKNRGASSSPARTR